MSFIVDGIRVSGAPITSYDPQGEPVAALAGGATQRGTGYHALRLAPPFLLLGLVTLVVGTSRARSYTRC